MKYLIPILLIVFVSCGNADEVEKEQAGELEIFKGGRSLTKLPLKRVDEKELSR